MIEILKEKLNNKILEKKIKNKLSSAIQLPENSFKENLFLNLKSELKNNSFILSQYNYKSNDNILSPYISFMNKKIIGSVFAFAIVALIAINSSNINAAIAANDLKNQIAKMSAAEFLENFNFVSKDTLLESLSITNAFKNAELTSAENYKKDFLNSISLENEALKSGKVTLSSEVDMTGKDAKLKELTDNLSKIVKVLKIKTSDFNTLSIGLDADGNVVSAITAGDMGSMQ